MSDKEVVFEQNGFKFVLPVDDGNPDSRINSTPQSDFIFNSPKPNPDDDDSDDDSDKWQKESLELLDIPEEDDLQTGYVNDGLGL